MAEEDGRPPRSDETVPLPGRVSGEEPTSAGAAAEETIPERAPERIGAYRIRRRIARGAMGAVYLAEQENPKRTVALKLIRSGRATPELLRRFEHEAHILGLLQHPGIAQIHEAGTADSEDGPRPYFAMELIDGVALTEYADEHALDADDRLDLVARVCDAVEHAHQKGVIHRDLKPSNILVDRTGQPKVLDFGVARATDSDQGATMGTSAGQIVGTLPYMSPEQVAGAPDDVDTRTDVYALGVILHELLAGQLPLEVADKPLPEIARMIREDDPLRLSSVDRRFRGDVETIVGKALAKEKAYRYQSVAALAKDIRHYLTDEPISARPPSARYQAVKFARRNRALVTGLAVGVLALALGLAGTLYGLLEARSARDRAEAEAATSGRVVELLVELLGGADPYTTGSPDTTVREVLDRGAGRISALDEDPLVQMQLLETMAEAYKNLGEYEAAAPLFERALEARLESDGTESIATARTQAALVSVYQNQTRYEEAVALARTALRTMESSGAAVAEDIVDAASPLVYLLIETAQYEEAEEVLDRTLARAGVQQSETAAVSMLGLRGILLARTDRLEEALTASRRAVEIVGADGRESLMLASLLSDQGAILAQLGRLDEAAPVLERALEINEQGLEPDHPVFAMTLHNLGSMNLELQNYDVAREYLERAVAVREIVYGDNHPAVTSSLNNLAKIHLDLGQYADALPLYERSARIREATLGPQHPALASTFHAMGDLHRLWERREQSVGYYERAIAIQEANETPDLPFALRSYAEVLDELGRGSEAEAARARAEALDEPE